MRIEPEISSVNIVLLGNFNPAIFTPAWFALHKMLPTSAAESADLGVAHDQLAMFSTEWLQIQVTPDSFKAETQQDPHVRLRDFVIRVFKEHLFHTPVKAFGINRNVHFRAPDAAARNRVGRMLAPVEPWRKCTHLQLDKDGNGMRSLTMMQPQPKGRSKGDSISVTVEPFVQVDDRQLGIYVRVNDHYEGDTTTVDGHLNLLDSLEKNFDSSIKRANGIVDHVMSLAKSR